MTRPAYFRSKPEAVARLTDLLGHAPRNGVNLRKVGHDRIGITVDERTRAATLESVWRAFGGYNLVYRDEYPKYRLPPPRSRLACLFAARSARLWVPRNRGSRR
jgi:hypothetical protein